MGGFSYSDIFEILSLKLRWVYRHEHSGSWAIQPALRPFMTFWYPLEGTILARVDQEKYHIRPGTLMLVPRHTLLSAGKVESTRLRYLSLGAELSFRSLEFSRVIKMPTTMSVSTDHALIDIWMKLIHEAENGFTTTDVRSPGAFSRTPFKGEILDSNSVQRLRLNALARKWLAELLGLVNPEEFLQMRAIDDRVLSAIGYIHDHFHEPLDLEMCARHAGISLSHLRHLFSEQLNCSPWDYVRQTRIDAAKRLLGAPEYSVREIARLTGHADISHFSRTFSKVVGQTPSAYRKSLEDQVSVSDTVDALPRSAN